MNTRTTPNLVSSCDVFPLRFCPAHYTNLKNALKPRAVPRAPRSPRLPFVVFADRDKVVQILMNLVGNALKFTPPHGRVTIAIDHTGDEWVRLSVADTGPGIPPEEAAKIFDKFYQMEQSNKQKAQGTGLGLAISKALVEMHGGKIWIEAGIDGGSIFSFTLPARRPLEI